MTAWTASKSRCDFSRPIRAVRNRVRCSRDKRDRISRSSAEGESDFRYSKNSLSKPCQQALPMQAGDRVATDNLRSDAHYLDDE